MLRRKQRDVFGNALSASPKDIGTYVDEGWWEDLNEIRGAIILLALAVLSFLAVVVVYRHGGSLDRFVGSGGPPGGAAATSNGSTSFGGLATLLTVVLSIVAGLWSAYTASENRHRVRDLAWVCAALSGVNLVAFLAFAILTA